KLTLSSSEPKPLKSRYAKRPVVETNQTARISLHLYQNFKERGDNKFWLRLYGAAAARHLRCCYRGDRVVRSGEALSRDIRRVAQALFSKNGHIPSIFFQAVKKPLFYKARHSRSTLPDRSGAAGQGIFCAGDQ
ncbi:hypothetical protein, partial [Oceanomicrobium pacificus]